MEAATKARPPAHAHPCAHPCAHPARAPTRFLTRVVRPALLLAPPSPLRPACLRPHGLHPHGLHPDGLHAGRRCACSRSRARPSCSAGSRPSRRCGRPAPYTPILTTLTLHSHPHPDLPFSLTSPKPKPSHSALAVARTPESPIRRSLAQVRLLETYDTAETDGFPVKLPALPFNVRSSSPRPPPLLATLTPRLPSPLLLILPPVSYWYRLPRPYSWSHPRPVPLALAVGPATVQADCHRHVPRRRGARPCCTLCTLCTLRTLCALCTLRTLRALIADSLRRCWCCATRPAVLMC